MTLILQYISEFATHMPVDLPNLLSQRKAGTCSNLCINSTDSYGLIQTLRSSRQKHWFFRSFHSNGMHLSIIIVHFCVSWQLWNYWRMEKGFHFSSISNPCLLCILSGQAATHPTARKDTWEGVQISMSTRKLSLGCHLLTAEGCLYLPWVLKTTNQS